MSGALLTILEKPRERFIHTPVRTYNRIRSSRLTASSACKNVGKGSRQVRSVTLGKGLALRAECLGSAFRSLLLVLGYGYLRVVCGLVPVVDERSGMVTGPTGLGSSSLHRKQPT